MSDKMEREIEEIVSRLDEPLPREGLPHRVRGLLRRWAAALRRTSAWRLPPVPLRRITFPWRWPRIPARRIMFASLVLVVLVAAGLFFGLVYPSLGDSHTSAGSPNGEIAHESVGDRIGGAEHEDNEWHEGSVDEALGADSREGGEQTDHESEDHEEGDRDRGERHR